MRSEAQLVPAPQTQRGRSYWAISLRRLLRKKLALACMAIILLMYGSGILSPLVAPYDYDYQDRSLGKQGPSLRHPFGTDRLGRDMFSRVIYGLRTTVFITVISLVTGSLALGITLGLLAGYFGRWADTIIMRAGAFNKYNFIT